MVAEMTKKIIKEKGLKHKYVAEQAGYTEKKFSYLLNGGGTIREQDILKIAFALGVTPNDLLGIKEAS